MKSNIEKQIQILKNSFEKNCELINKNVPQFKEKIFNSLKVSINFKNNNFYDKKYNLIIPFNFFEDIHNQVKNETGLNVFDENIIQKCQNKIFKCVVDYDDYLFKVEVQEHLKRDLNLVENYELKVMLPTYEEVFAGFLEDLYEFYADYIEEYEQFSYDIMNKNKPTIQIGGHGYFIQNSYENFILDYNNGIGDNGSCYLFIYNDEIQGETQCY